MNILIDTNVILENFLQRERYNVAHHLFENLRKQGHMLFLSSGSFYTMVFLVDKYLKRECNMTGELRLSTLRQILLGILNDIGVAGHDKASLLRGVNNIAFKDIEDGCQLEAAKNAGCEFLLTFNKSDYPTESNSGVKVLSPEEYLDFCKK